MSTIKKYNLAILIVLVCFLCFFLFFIYVKYPRKLLIYKEIAVIHTNKTTTGKLWHIITSDQVRQYFSKEYEIKIPKLDFTKRFLLMTDGRKVKKITYDVWNIFCDCSDVPEGKAYFEKNYQENTMIFYEIEKKDLESPS